MTRSPRMAWGPAVLALALALSVSGPALAHEAGLRMDATTNDAGEVSGVATLDPPHENTPILMILFKKRADGSWAEVARSRDAQQVTAGVYVHNFGKVRGDKRCRIKGVFKETNHNTARDISRVINC